MMYDDNICIINYLDTGNGDLDVRIVGQEQDGTVLYTWAEASIFTQDGTDVTYFGCYDPLTKVNQVSFISQDLFPRLSASVIISL